MGVDSLRHAIITAGSKGLGKVVTETFLQNGHSVTVNYRSDEQRIEELRDEWRAYSDRLQFVQGDICEKETITRIVDRAVEKFGRVDFLINNAGPYIFKEKKLADYEESEWYEMIEGNLSAVFHFIKRVIPIMRKQRFGRIVTYGFQDAHYAPGWVYRSAYSAAKVGLVSLTKSIALEEAENGITANMVSPGDITGKMKEASIAIAKSATDDKTPIGRPGSGGDIARIIAFLCEEDADFITGTVVEGTGGINVVNRRR